MNTTELTLNIPDTLLSRMKALGISNPAPVIEVILGWIEEGHIAEAREAPAHTEEWECTPYVVRVPAALLARIATESVSPAGDLLETFVHWIQDDHIRDANHALRRTTEAQDYVSEQVVQWLGTGDELDAPEIWDALRGSSPTERREAIMFLSRIGAPAVPGLIKMLREQSTSARLAAARALATIAHPSAVPGLRDAMDGQGALVGEAILIALENIGTADALAVVTAWR
jgi:hypothetical protein